MPFKSLGLHPALVQATAALGFTKPTPIQEKAIPAALAGKDVLGGAQTGGGKTAAFMLPVLHHLYNDPTGQALVLVPTRELAVQVERVVKECSKFSHVKTAVIIGGVGHGGQTQAVRAGARVIVATPGRLLDHLEQKNFRLDRITQLVLDEADRMFDMGFLPDIKAVLKWVPADRQTQLYSATLHKEIEKIAAFALRNPVRVEIERPSTVAEGISQVVYPVIQSQKIQLLLTLLATQEMKSVLVFSRTKHGADKIAARLTDAGFRTGVLHSNRSQNQRQAAMDDFRHARTRLLVATDIAARGIDVKGISHVVNFDVPRFAEDYVHRVGRTARAYGVGDAILLMDPSEKSLVRAIEKLTGITFPLATLPDFQYNSPPKHVGPAAGTGPQGHRSSGQRPGGHRSPGHRSTGSPRPPSGEKRPFSPKPKFGSDRPRFQGPRRDAGPRNSGPRDSNPRSPGRFDKKPSERSGNRWGGGAQGQGENQPWSPRFGTPRDDRPRNKPFRNDRFGSTGGPGRFDKSRDDRPRNKPFRNDRFGSSGGPARFDKTRDDRPQNKPFRGDRPNSSGGAPRFDGPKKKGFFGRFNPFRKKDDSFRGPKSGNDRPSREADGNRRFEPRAKPFGSKPFGSKSFGGPKSFGKNRGPRRFQRPR